MAGLAAGLPDPLVGLAPGGGGAADLVGEHRPQPLRDVVALLGVHVDRVEHGAEHVVLALVEGAVADPHRARALVAAEVIERRLGEVHLALDPVHDLQRAVLAAGHVGDVLDEVVGLPVQTQRVQPPQREGGVAHPAVAVVPVAFPAGRLRQRGGGRGHERAGGHERQSLQRQRRTLQVDPPGVIGVVAFGQPATPELGRGLQPLLGLLDGHGPAPALRPRQRAVALLPLRQRVAPVRAVALDAHADVAVQPHRRVAVAVAARRGC